MKKEDQRLQVLQEHNILDSEPEESYDDLVSLAAQLCNTQYAQINFIDKTRQWAKATVGDAPVERPRAESFCDLTINKKNGLFVVEDAARDDQYESHAMAQEPEGIRYYAGISIRSANGVSLGTLCVFDSRPDRFSTDHIKHLRVLRNQVETHLRLRLKERKLEGMLSEENRLNRKIINSLPVNFFMYNSGGEMVRWNKNIRHTTGYDDPEISMMRPADYFSERDRPQVDQAIDEALDNGQSSLEVELLRKDGTRSPFIFSTSRFRSNEETYLIGTGQDISEQKRYQQELQKSLQEKEVLLAEVHHRVNNNLAIISGLIELEMMHSEEGRKGDYLRNTQQRIRSIALIHEMLYRNESFSQVNFDDVIERIIDFICARYRNLTDGIDYRTNVDPMTLNVNQAIPCALIINELLTNASKHAFPRGRNGGVVEVELTKTDDQITLRVADNGRGLPADYGPSESKTMGFMLVETLCKQLKAEIQTHRQSGTEFMITFDKKDDAKGAGSTFVDSGKIAS